MSASNIYAKTSTASSKNLASQQMDKLTREVKEITALYNIGVVVGSSLDLKGVIWGLYKESSRLINTSNFAIIIFDDNTKTLNFVLTIDQGERREPFSVHLSGRNSLIEQVLATKKPTLVHNLPVEQKVTQVAEFERLRPEKQIYSWLGVPVINSALSNAVPQGVIAMWGYTPNAFSEHDLWLLSAIGIQAAIAIRNARLYESSQRRASEMTFLNEVARTLSSTLQLDEVLTRIMEHVEGMLNVEAGSLLLTDPSTGDLVFQIALGNKAEEIKPFRVPKGQGIAGEVSQTGKPLVVANAAQDKRHFKKLDREINFQTRNILCVPLVLYDKIIGVLQVINKKDGNFTGNDQELLSSIASYAAIAIQNARLHQNVLAERDRVIEAEEQARKELARELHDGPTQIVASIMMSLDFCEKALQRDPSLLPKELHYLKGLAGRANHQMRTMLFELRPLVLETQGLVSAIETFLARRQADIANISALRLTIKTHNSSGELSRQDEKVESTVFAIIQETVNNAIKHARANNIVVQLHETHQAFFVVIADDGQGFDVEAVMSKYEQRGSLGMVNIRERTELIGGELTIKSTPGKGSRFTIFVPKEAEIRLRKRGRTGPLNLPPEAD